MANIQVAKIGSRKSVAPGATKTVRWNNPPWATVLSYTAVPIPASASGPHGTSNGEVEVTHVRLVHKRDNYNGDKQQVQIDVRNTGSSETEFDLYQSWIA